MLRQSVVCVLVGLAASAALVHGQPIEKKKENIAISASFGFFPPGARAMGIGGAFLAIADDATAAEANPAGLTILSKPEVSAHMRFASVNNQFPNYFLYPQTIDTYSDSVVSPSFFSFVYPFGTLAVSAYYSQQTNFRSHARFRGQWVDYDDELGDIVVLGVDGTSLDLLSDNIGFSVAGRPLPMLSIGGSVRFTRMDIKSVEDAAVSIPFEELVLNEELFFSYKQTVADRANQVTFNFGMLANPNGRVSGGFFYKQGADFELATSGEYKECLFCGGDLVVYEDELDPSIVSIPSAYGGGVAFRPTDNWLIALDVLRITYSDNTADCRPEDDYAGCPLAFWSEGGIEPIKDGTEIHFGVEYTFLSGDTPIALRAGAFTDPDHDGIVDVDSSQLHVTFGGGVVVADRFQFDGAVNIAEYVQEVLLSFVFRFQ
jgi:long-subunit fatty acid transport protein